MDKNIDLRISRTHKMIKDAFFELMCTIGLEKITVQNLTKKAMVSRTTFYLHYKDKYDLLDQIENEILDGFKSLISDLHLDELVTNGISDKKSFSLLVEIYENIYEYIKENQHFFTLIISKNGNNSFFYKLNKTMKLTVTKYIIEDRLKIPKNYAIAFAIGFHTSVINEWINSGMKETPYEIASMMAQVMQDVPKHLYE